MILDFGCRATIRVGSLNFVRMVHRTMTLPWTFTNAIKFFCMCGGRKRNAKLKVSDRNRVRREKNVYDLIEWLVQLNSWLHVEMSDGRALHRRTQFFFHTHTIHAAAHTFGARVGLQRAYKSSDEVWCAERKELGGCFTSISLAFYTRRFLSLYRTCQAAIVLVLSVARLFLKHFHFVRFAFGNGIARALYPNALKCHSFSLVLLFWFASHLLLFAFPKKNTHTQKHWRNE